MADTTAPHGPEGPEGIDAARLEPWLAAHVAGAVPPFSYDLIVGGQSNLTFRVTDGGGKRYVLRRPPALAHLLATAHDVLREHRLMAALAGTPVPVPRMLAATDDPAVNGASFFVAEYVDGVVLDSPAKAAPMPDDARRELAFNLVDVLAALHGVDVDAVGLGDLARRDAYLERQLRRWSKQWEGSKTRDLPVVDEVVRRLSAGMPPQEGTAIVHGDYRFGNCISDLAGRKIAAVLDWELCTLGDPLADIGHLALYWHDPALSVPMTNDPTSAGGFPAVDELLQRYAARTGRDVSRIGYYRAFAAFRLAIIAEGIVFRRLQVKQPDVQAIEASKLGVQRLAEAALRWLGG